MVHKVNKKNIYITNVILHNLLHAAVTVKM